MQVGYRMVFFRGLTLTCEDSNKDQYFIIWRTVKLSGLRESEANLISGSDGRKMFYKTKKTFPELTVAVLLALAFDLSCKE